MFEIQHFVVREKHFTKTEILQNRTIILHASPSSV